MLAKVKSTFSEGGRHPQISHTEADPPPPINLLHKYNTGFTLLLHKYNSGENTTQGLPLGRNPNRVCPRLGLMIRTAERVGRCFSRGLPLALADPTAGPHPCN
jgi:hypothetical protein